MTLPDFDAFFALMRKHGVSKFSDTPGEGGAYSVEFFPSTADVAPTKATPDADACKCGHGAHEHNAGLCLRGCDVEKCAGVEVAP